MKKLIASATIVASTLGVGAATAFAAGTDTPAATSQGDGQGQGRRHGLLRSALRVAADTIGVSPAELKQAVQGGQTVAQVAEAKGVAAQQVIDAVVQAATTKIDEAVAAGTIDAQRAETLKAKLPDAATRLVNETGQHRGERSERRQGRRQAVIDAAAKTLNISSDALRDALQKAIDEVKAQPAQ